MDTKRVAANPWHRTSLSNEALLEKLLDCQELTDEERAFTTKCVADLELSKRFAGAVRDRLMAIAKGHKLIGTKTAPQRVRPKVEEQPGQKTFQLPVSNADREGAARFDDLIAGSARAVLAHKPPLRRVG